MKNNNKITITFSKADKSELGEIISLLADDLLRSSREAYDDLLPDSYRNAFTIIQADSNARLITAKHNDKIIEIAQINFLT